MADVLQFLVDLLETYIDETDEKGYSSSRGLAAMKAQRPDE